MHKGSKNIHKTKKNTFTFYVKTKQITAIFTKIFINYFLFCS